MQAHFTKPPNEIYSNAKATGVGSSYLNKTQVKQKPAGSVEQKVTLSKTPSQSLKPKTQISKQMSKYPARDTSHTKLHPFWISKVEKTQVAPETEESMMEFHPTFSQPSNPTRMLKDFIEYNSGDALDEYQQILRKMQKPQTTTHNTRFFKLSEQATQPLTTHKRLYSSSPSWHVNAQGSSSIVRACTIEDELIQMPREHLLSNEKEPRILSSRDLIEASKQPKHQREKSKSSMKGNKDKLNSNAQQNSGGRKTMLLYTSVKEPGVKIATSMRRLNSGSFNEESHKTTGNHYNRTTLKTTEGENIKISFIRGFQEDEAEGEIKEDSDDDVQNGGGRERTEMASIPLSNQSKSKERIVNNTTTIKRQSAQLSNALIYQSSPTKFSTIEIPLNNPINHLKSKQVFMFKPSKLSSTHTDNATTTPDKAGAELHIDITLDLSSKELEYVPKMPNFLNQGAAQQPPTIIDLRKNRIKSLPLQLFQLPMLRQLKLDNNLITNLPEGSPLLDVSLCRLQTLSLAFNQLQSLPDWLFNTSCQLRHTLEKLDLTFNMPPFSHIPDGLCIFENMKTLLLQGNQITTLPCAISRLVKVEEFGLEWWQYIVGADEVYIGKKIQLGMMRDESVVTNRQTLRQIFEGLRLVNQSNNQPFGHPPQRIAFCHFYRLFKRTYSPSKLQREDDCRIKSLFQIICHFGHDFIMNQLLTSECPKLNLNLPEAKFSGQTLLQVALQTSEDIGFLAKILDTIQSGNFEVYLTRPNEEQPLQRQLQLLHPIMITLKRRMIPLTFKILEIMLADHAKSGNGSALSLDIKDENRNSLYHIAFQLIQDDQTKQQAIELCLKLVEISLKKALIHFNDVNKQGMTPLDLAIELKINEAVDLAMDTNKASTPLFDPNANANQRGLTPLHRCVQAHNHYALSLLLKSMQCRTLVRDKDFKRARDYCQRMLFMQKMIRCAENIELLANYQAASAMGIPICDHHIIRLVDSKVKCQNIMPQSSGQVVSAQKPSKNFKRSASSDLKESHSILGTTEKKPFKIEKPMPIDRLNHIYNKTIVDTFHPFPAIQEEQLHFPQQPSIVKRQKHKSVVTRGTQHSRKVSQLKPRLAQPLPQHLQSYDHTSPGFNEDDPPVIELKNKQVFSSSIKREQINLDYPPREEISNFDTFVFDDADASEESPSALPSKKFQYVMTVNNSKLARRPYYKQLVKNEFEELFCSLMEPPSYLMNKHSGADNDFARKYAILYSVYHSALTSQSVQTKRDAKEFFTILTHELLDPVEGAILKALTNEIVYLNDRLHHVFPDIESLQEKQQPAVRAHQSLIKSSTPNLKLSSFASKKELHFSNLIEQPTILRGPNFATNHEAQNAFNMMQSMRQSVSLKQLIQGIRINAQNFTESTNALMSIEEQLKAFETKRKTMSHHYHQGAKSQQAVHSFKNTGAHSQRVIHQEQKPFFDFKSTQQQIFQFKNTPTSPRGNSGQIHSKDQVGPPSQLDTHQISVQQLVKTAEKEQYKPNKLLMSEADIKSPNPAEMLIVQSSEQSVSSQQTKRRQANIVLDSSIRTVSINIEEAVVTVPLQLGSQRGSSIGQHLKSRHSKMVVNNTFSPTLIVGSKAKVKNSQGKPTQSSQIQITVNSQAQILRQALARPEPQRKHETSLQQRSQSTSNRQATFMRPNMQAKFMSGFTNAAAAVNLAQFRLRQERLRKEQRSIERDQNKALSAMNNPGS